MGSHDVPSSLFLWDLAGVPPEPSARRARQPGKPPYLSTQTLRRRDFLSSHACAAAAKNSVPAPSLLLQRPDKRHDFLNLVVRQFAGIGRHLALAVLGDLNEV